MDCSQEDREVPPGESELTVLILLFDGVEVLDFAGPFEVFSVASQLMEATSVQVLTVAESEREVTALGGLRVVPACTLERAPPADILVVPGGDGTRREMDNPTIVRWVRAVEDDAMLVMSVCSGARILAKAGMLDGRTVTTHHQVMDHLRQLAPRARVEAGHRFIDEGSLLTTGGISAGIDASLYVVSRFFGVDSAARAARYMEYEWELGDVRESGS